MKKISIIVALALATGAGAVDLTYQFVSPAFNGNGFSSHVLTIQQMEAANKKAIRDAEASAKAQADIAASNTPLAKFMVNVESRIYAQLSKQLADQLFSGGGTSGTLKFEDTTINWSKTSTDVTLVVVSPTGTTTLTVPIGTFAF